MVLTLYLFRGIDNESESLRQGCHSVSRVRGPYWCLHCPTNLAGTRTDWATGVNHQREVYSSNLGGQQKAHEWTCISTGPSKPVSAINSGRGITA